MAKYSNTKAKINEKITTNGAQNVTGSILNDVLQTMVDSLGADYQFGGLVQPGSSFTAGEQPVVFLATTPGTYTHFGGLVVADGEVALLVWSGSAWSKQTPDIATRTEVSQLGQKLVFSSLLSNIEQYKYITDAGAIGSATDPSYLFSAFEIKKSDFYLVDVAGCYHPRLAKYSDSSYAGNGTILLAGNTTNLVPYKGLIYLSAGYYAICCLSTNGAYPCVYNCEEISDIVSPQFKSAFRWEAVQNRLIISSSGAIVPASDAYYTVKLYIEKAGRFLIKNIGNSQRILAKYTDSTYNTFDSFIIEAESSVNGIYELSAGFYAFSWREDISTIPTFFCIDDIVDIFERYEEKPLIRKVEQKNYSSKFITDDGQIAGASPQYVLSTFHIENDGEYYLGNSVSNPSHPILAKYVDATYSGYGQIIIPSSSISVDAKYHLSAGYYALCGNNYQTLTVFDYTSTEHFLDIVYSRRQNFNGGIRDFSGFVQNTASSWSIVSKDKIESMATGFSNRIYAPIDTFEDYFILSLVITPKTTDNGKWEFAFGRYGEDGTIVKIGVDANGQFISISRVNSDTITLASRYELTSLRMNAGDSVSVVLQKDEDTINFFNLMVTDGAGNTFKQERIAGFGNAGLGYGYISLWAITGTFRVEKIGFVYPKDATNIKLAILGHSFVAGHNSTIYDQDKKFASLLANDVGIKNTCIFGRGGGSVTMLPALQTQLNWVSSVRYAIIMLGANDADNQYTTGSFKSFDEYMKGLGIFPIWLSIPVLANGTQGKPLLAQYIKDNFYYVDIDNVFVDENGDPIPEMYFDSIHPSIEGYRRMYEVIKNQCSFIFGI